MIETCGGYCCERFRIRNYLTSADQSFSLEQIQELAEGGSPDIKKVAAMLVYLGKSKVNGNGLEDEVESHWYTCKHFDTETRLCKDYEERPDMCRNHGDIQGCIFDKCQLKLKNLAGGGELKYDPLSEG